MFDASMIMMLATLTPTHPGSGTELSYVDLPIQREIHTGFPKIEASTLKGSIRNAITNNDEEKRINQIFGEPNGGDYASAISFSDARLLFFPVKSVLGVFAWITCPMAIQRFFGDYQMLGGTEIILDLKEPEEGKSFVTNLDRLVQTVKGRSKIMLEDYTFCTETNSEFLKFVKMLEPYLPDSKLVRERIINHAVMLNDNDFTDFVKHSTEINTRIKINSLTGTAADNALFTEEFLPSDCILYNLLFFTDTYMPQDKLDRDQRLSADDAKKEFKRLFKQKIFQIGADSTLGKGLIMRSFWELGGK
ncbi:type III-B CRISPR module RAMP protein Cmr4 [Clostridium sp. chh4-2]|uniref:type III-B CRISPR module RAMP protein Cmr4 n=1 Tax=Clostridium sp. chh4-2 TaxID=2067550 RepID=UPI000CCDE849|nr:type III-B CRISPR module RAMP protein Cmr4 [Clostridium sp. chh4-2]PNV61261.1 type III-B CRISPR module RAMP protein Cmr4 [Clostridium sp. chh4-2]